VNLNGNLIFSANNGTNGREIFKSDGTTANTTLLKDCYSGENGSSPKELTKIGNYVYFSALGGPRPDWWGGYELWRTDGTTNGTVFIKDVNQSHISSEPRNFKGYNNEVYFVATEGSGYKYIYKTNGNVGNTSTVTNVPVAEDDYAIINGMLIFIKNNSMLSKQEVWQKNLSTGTESLVLSPSSLFVGISHSNSNYAFLTTGGNVYAYNGSTLTNIFSGSGSNYVSIGSNTYFTSNNSVYKTDGTSAGTISIKSFPIDAIENEWIHSLVNVNGTLAFAVNTYITDVYGQPVYKGYIYKSNGTAAGTVLVSTYTPFPGSSNSVQISIGSLTAGIGNKLYYVVRQNGLYYGSSQDESDYSRLMVTDLGTNTNQLLMRVSDINGHFYQLHTSILANNKLFFSLNDHAEIKGGLGNELWVYDINCPTDLNMTQPTPPDMGRTLQASNTITSNAEIFANEIPITTLGPVPAQVDFRASKAVILLPGFEASKNKIFKAEIGGCN
jgi:ELWxxDGT repeat protein